MNIAPTQNSVQAAAVPYVNTAEIDDNTRYAAGQAMGEPTEHLRGKHISHYQKQKRGPGGFRTLLKMNESRARAEEGTANANAAASLAASRGAAAAAAVPGGAAPCTPAGRSDQVERYTNRLTEILLDEAKSPGTQMAAEEVLEDYIQGKNSTAANHVRVAEGQCKPIGMSQQIAVNAVRMKKVERKRKQMNNYNDN